MKKMKKIQCLVCPLWDIITGGCDYDNIKSSDMFVVPANKHWLEQTKKGDSKVMGQLQIVKNLSKKVLLVMDTNLTTEEKAELEGILAGYSVTKIIEVDMSDDSSRKVVHEQVKKALDQEYKDGVTVTNE